VLLDAYGLTQETIKSFGGRYLYREFPRLCPPLVITGEANAVINEALMLPDWRDLAERRPTRFLSVRDDVLASLEQKYHFRSRSVHAGRLPGQTEPLRTLDFSGWMLVTTTALSDDLAYFITSIMVEERQDLERMYNSAPVQVSPLTYPIRPYHMAETGETPLHPGAARYYRERGLFERWT
jgi:TRAP-type uncharacterized transport system substrate-binding protein